MFSKHKILSHSLFFFMFATVGTNQLQAEPKSSPPPQVAKKNLEETYRQLNLFGDVFERVKNFYVEDVKDVDLIESALNGMLTSLDPHSSYLNPQEFKEMQTQTRGEFGGIGIEFIMENGYIKVITAIDGTPAEKEGLKANDYITHIDTESVLGMTSNGVVKKMRGNVGDPLTLTVKRGEPPQTLEIKLSRALIKVKSVRSERKGNIGYIRLTIFNEQTQPGLEKAIKDLQNEIGDQLIGYILDLRNNPGGLLETAISVTDTFLDEGEIVSTKSRIASNDQRFFANKGDLTNGKPLVVLINEGSASASEIVAGALKDHKRAILVGTRSFGKGSVQTIMPLSDQGAMRITTALYYTPSGVSIQALGIEPDIDVPLAKIEEVHLKRISEADLKNAIKNGTKPGQANTNNKASGPNGEDSTSADDKKDTKEALREKLEKPAEKTDKASDKATSEDGTAIFDYQLERAKDLLIGLSVYDDTSKAKKAQGPKQAAK